MEPMLKFLSLLDFARGRGMVLPSYAEILNIANRTMPQENILSFDDGVLHSGMVLGGYLLGLSLCMMYVRIMSMACWLEPPCGIIRSA